MIHSMEYFCYNNTETSIGYSDRNTDVLIRKVIKMGYLFVYFEVYKY